MLLVGNPKSIFGFAQLARVPNLGLCSIAAFVDRTLFDVRVVDLVLKGHHASSYFQRLLRSFQPDLIGISCMVFQYGEAVALARQVKLCNPHAKTVIGGYHPTVAYVVETSRGCTYDCNFCSISQMYGRTYRTYKIERILDDIRDATKRGAHAIMITDDNITLDGARYKELCEAITDAKLNSIRYSVQAGVRGIKCTPGLVKAMAESGVEWVFLGIEGVSDSMLASMKKDTQFSTSDAVDVVQELKQYDITVIGGFILGYPNDTEETFWSTLEYALKIKLDIPLFQILTPYPKTAIREELLRLGLVTNEHDYSKYTCYHIDKQSLLFDLEILFATIPVVLFGRGAHSPALTKSKWATSPQALFLHLSHVSLLLCKSSMFFLYLYAVPSTNGY